MKSMVEDARRAWGVRGCMEVFTVWVDMEVCRFVVEVDRRGVMTCD